MASRGALPTRICLCPEASKSRRKLQPRDSDAQIERSVKKHFCGVAHSVLETELRDGKSLRQHIKDAKKALGPKQRLGAKFWCELASLFNACDEGEPWREIRSAMQ